MSDAGDRLGATALSDGRWAFSVWAPGTGEVRVSGLAGGDVGLVPTGDGYHRGVADGCPPGARYRYVLDDGPPLPDPASRWQPEGVHGPSAVVAVDEHRWCDAGFVAPPLWAQVIYELHVGTFTAQGTLDAALGAVDHLTDLGVTTVELMPVAQFPGQRNWGYDGVFPFAVHDSYGGPGALQRFVDGCHQRGLAVVLDVVYNHVGPEGNILDRFGPYFTDRYVTPWGRAVNFDGPGSDDVRRFFIENALGWFRDFHVDGLRLDAIHSIVDPTARPFLAELVAAVSDLAAVLGRPCTLIGESADNNPSVVSPAAVRGLGLDAQWNDDFHHALHAVVTGEDVGYYRDFGRADQVARALAQGFVYQGEYSNFRGRRHGASSVGVAPARFVVFAQNHDQIGNRPRGDRLSTLVAFDALRLICAVVLLSPGVPLLFMGEEYAETAPFPYFVDHGDAELVAAVRAGRAAEFATGWGPGEPLDPADPSTFTAARLDIGQSRVGDQARLFRLYRRLIALRRCEPALGRSAAHEVSAAASGDVVTMVRRGHRSTVAALFNLAPTTGDAVVPEAPAGGRWRTVVDSDDPDLGGRGRAATGGETAAVLVPFGFVLLGCTTPGEGGGR
ncbi:MAG: malto-oligosyltrehalose trehalohydrolase [Acidimicrobiales bacterium]